MADNYLYSNSKALSQIIGLLPSDWSTISVTLRPDIPEFSNYDKRHSLDANNDVKMWNNWRPVLEKNNIGLQGLVYNFDGIPSPTLELSGPQGLHIKHYRDYAYDPVHLATNTKWFEIRYDDVHHKKNITQVKTAVDKFMHKGYFISRLHVKLYKPKDFSRNRNTVGELMAEDGNIEVWQFNEDLEKILDNISLLEKPALV